MTQQIDKGLANEVADPGKQIRCFYIQAFENVPENIIITDKNSLIALV